MTETPKLKRILLKLSGESLMGNGDFGYSADVLHDIVEDIKEVLALGIQVCIVVGGGNIYRGKDGDSLGIQRSSGDYMGMLATVINALALQSTLEQHGIYTRVQSAITMTSISEPFIRRKAVRHMQKNRIVIFAAGIGSPFFTTDSAAVLRAVEMNCDCLLKGTNVDGVYDKDPRNNENATKYSKISYDEILQNQLQIMDMASIALARENQLPIKVFSIKQKGNLAKVIQNQGDFTMITQ